MNTFVVYPFCTALFAACFCGCSSQKAALPTPNRMTLIHYQPSVGRDLHVVYLPEFIAAWEELFPSYAKAVGARKQFWVAAYEVTFMRPDGTASWVLASTDQWTNGKGDFPMTGDVDALYAKTTNYLHYLDVNWPRAKIQADGTVRVNFRAELLEDGTLRKIDPPVPQAPEPEGAP